MLPQIKSLMKTQGDQIMSSALMILQMLNLLDCKTDRSDEGRRLQDACGTLMDCVEEFVNAQLGSVRTTVRSERISKSGGKKTTRCFHCGVLGHIARNCKKRATEWHLRSKASAGLKVPRPEEKPRSEETKKSVTKIQGWRVSTVMARHVTNERSDYETYKALKKPKVLEARGCKYKAVGVGEVKLKRGNNVMKLEEVMHVPEMSSKYFSVGHATKNGRESCFVDDRYELWDRDKKMVLVKGHWSDGAYRITDVRQGNG